MKTVKTKSAWVVSVNMGYGHDRAAYPLKDIAYKGVLTANDYEDIPESDNDIWENSRRAYEKISRMREIPVIGEPIFELFDYWQEIPSFYPRRDLSRPRIQTRSIYRLFKTKNFLKHLITEELAKKDLPLVTTFFIPALAAEYYGFPNDIYVVLTDTDISRAWVPKFPKKTKIKFFAPSRRVVERLKLYGVPEENILLTGFPLPKLNIGGTKYQQLKKDIARRLVKLDPKKHYISRFEDSIGDLVGKLPKRVNGPLTIMFAVGGAGAQKKEAIDIMKSLRRHIENKKFRLLLVAGSRPEVAKFFKKAISFAGLKREFGNGVDIVFHENKDKYFALFNKMLRNTDILWTKPSELSFYTGFGIPIIMAEPIGSQEDFNRQWLFNAGSGIDQRDAKYSDEWLVDWLESGWLARAALNGFIHAPKRGTYRIESYVAHEACVLPEPIEPI